jgi:hypothetical protein
MRTQNLFRAMLVMLGLFAFSASSYAHWDVGISVAFAPPLLPVYVQPPCPGAGYLWTPGYWAYDDEAEDGYYWVPGTWVLAPRPGLLWTPGYWGAEGAYFAWHPGYWGPTVGFYGGINYGFGYFGIGFAGGYWRDHDFHYNRAVANVTNVSITNVYNNTVVNNQVTNTRVSYNGGPHGTRLRPSGSEEAAARAAHHGPTNEQWHHELAARSTPALRLAANHGIPPIAASPKAAVFAGHGLTAARGAVGAAPGVARNALPGRTDVASTHAPSGAFAARFGRDQPSHAATLAPPDRPAWGSRGGAQLASANAPTAPAAPRAAAAGRAWPGSQYRPGAQSEYAAPDRPGFAAVSRQNTRAPVSSEARSYAYPAARVSAARPAAVYAAHEPARATYAQRTPTPPRDYGHAPSFGAPHQAANPPPLRPYNAQHAGSQNHGDMHGSRQS